MKSKVDTGSPERLKTLHEDYANNFSPQALLKKKQARQNDLKHESDLVPKEVSTSNQHLSTSSKRLSLKQ